MLRRSFLQGFFSLALFPRKVLPKRRAIRHVYKNLTIYLHGKKMKLGEEIFVEGHVAPSPGELKDIIIGRLDGYANAKFVQVFDINIRKI